MKVAFITRSTLFSVPGGDTVQMLETAKHVNALGVCADIKLTNEIINYDDYSLLHFFNITRPADILYHISKSKKPFVVSTIFIDYSQYDKFYRPGISGAIFRFLSRDTIEWLKATARYISGKDKMMSLSYIFKGQRKCITEILHSAKLLLPNSKAEYELIALLYKTHANYIVVPNGINNKLFQPCSDVKKDPLMILCVARVEGRKNQMNLIRALNGTPYKLLLIGGPAPNQLSYYKQCRQIASPNISFIDQMPQEELLAYYSKAKVHILASWFETTGLSSLEAAAMGCNVIITDKGFAKEYFGEDAFYCNPESPENIFATVEKASKLETSKTLPNKIFTNYTWQQASLQTLKAYREATEK